MARSRTKYHSQKVEYHGMIFDSKKELRRYKELWLMEQAGAIEDLRRQVKFILIPAQREPDQTGPRGGIIKGKVIERECAYIADFVYRDCMTDKTVVEDAKGVRTTDYVIKRKLLLERYGIRIKEI